MAKTLNGIDVSEFQGEIEWDKVKSAGIDFALLRAGYGSGAAQKDASFESNIREAHKNGIFIGVYWYSYATSNQGASEEAKACLKIIEQYRQIITMPVCYQYGEDSIKFAARHGRKATRDAVTAFTAVFNEEIKKAGYFSAYYASPEFLSAYINTAMLNSCDLWLACENNASLEKDNPLPSYDMGLWQYTKKGRVEGIRTAVGMNISFREYRTAHAPKSRNIGNQNTGRNKIYIVRAGDTLSSIAYRHKTTYRRLMARNNIKNPNLIFPGQRIVID